MKTSSIRRVVAVVAIALAPAALGASPASAGELPFAIAARPATASCVPGESCSANNLRELAAAINSCLDNEGSPEYTNGGVHCYHADD